MIGGDDGAVAGHPQAALRRLLQSIGVARARGRRTRAGAAAARSRARFLSEALRPGGIDACLGGRRSGPAPTTRSPGSRCSSRPSEAEEALALAIAMREALETPGKTAALITPDPAIARRVAAELARWDIEVENSAGRALGETSAGAFARLALAAALDFAPAPIAALLGASARAARAVAPRPSAPKRARWSSACCARRRRRAGSTTSPPRSPQARAAHRDSPRAPRAEIARATPICAAAEALLARARRRARAVARRSRPPRRWTRRSRRIAPRSTR